MGEIKTVQKSRYILYTYFWYFLNISPQISFGKLVSKIDLSQANILSFKLFIATKPSIAGCPGAWDIVCFMVRCWLLRADFKFENSVLLIHSFIHSFIGHIDLKQQEILSPVVCKNKKESNKIYKYKSGLKTKKNITK